jgi:hypothetical protein
MSATPPESKHITRTSEPPSPRTVPKAQPPKLSPTSRYPWLSLPDTPSNRRMLSRWADQDSRTSRIQRKLFSHVESDPPPEAQIEINASETLTPEISKADFNVTPKLLLCTLDVSKLISSSEISRTLTSETVVSPVITNHSLDFNGPTPDFSQQPNPDCRSFSLQRQLPDFSDDSMISGGISSRTPIKSSSNAAAYAVRAEPSADFDRHPSPESESSPNISSKTVAQSHSHQLPTSKTVAQSHSHQLPTSNFNLHPDQEFESFNRKAPTELWRSHPAFRAFKRQSEYTLPCGGTVTDV